MKFLETPEEKKIIHNNFGYFCDTFSVVYYFGLTYMDPPPENGIAVNFELSDNR